MQKIASWLYLLLLNFAYYILLCRFLERKPQMEVYESKRLNCKKSESEAYPAKNPQVSVAANRDLLKKHDPNKDYNVYWELLLSSPTPQFTGFYEGRKEAPADTESARYLEELDITLAYGKREDHLEGIREIQRGILDFADDYYCRFKEFPCMFHVSGRDAYAPMLLAASHHERYLKAILHKFTFEKNLV